MLMKSHFNRTLMDGSEMEEEKDERKEAQSN